MRESVQWFVDNYDKPGVVRGVKPAAWMVYIYTAAGHCYGFSRQCCSMLKPLR